MQNDNTRYYPNQRFDIGFFAIWSIMFHNIRRSRFLIYQLLKRDLFAQYKKSFVGIGWALITPIFAILSWLLMRMTGILNPGELDIPYPVYILMGATCWRYFASMIDAGARTLSAGKDLIQQVNYPHEVIFFQQLLLKNIDFLISFIIVNLAIALLGVYPSWKIIFLPLVMIPCMALGSSVGLLLAIIGVVAVDVTRFVNSIIGFLIYTVPIIYSDKVESELLQFVNKYNPLTYLVCSMRDLVLFGNLYEWRVFIVVSVVSILILIFVLKTFYVLENKIIERMI
ncbi:MAG: ABC transporter permease [Cyclobacteriaceae bacterium]